MRSMQQQLGVLGTISAFAQRQKETKKTLCRGGRSQDLPDTDFQPAIRQLQYVRQQYAHSKTIHMRKQRYIQGNNTIHKRPTTFSSNAPRKNNIMRKHCTQFLILLFHRYSTPILTGALLHFTSPTINTLHGTPRFSPLHCTTLHFISLRFTTLFR